MSFSTVWNNWQQQRKAVNKINLELSKVLRVEAVFSLKFEALNNVSGDKEICHWWRQ